MTVHEYTVSEIYQIYHPSNRDITVVGASLLVYLMGIQKNMVFFWNFAWSQGIKTMQSQQ